MRKKELWQALERLNEENKNYQEEQELLIRQLEDLNKKLQHSESFKSNFLSNIRNEINNPVGAVLGLARNMKKIDPAKKEKIKMISGLIYAEMKDLDFQLRNIFIAADLEAGEAKPEVMNVDVEILMNNTIDLVKDKLESKELKLVSKFESVKWKEDKSKKFFKTDAGKLQLILVNILMNAIEFSPSQETIEIVVFDQNDRLGFKITNFGNGFENVEPNQIFNRFIKTETSPIKKYKGHGLGLAVTKDLLEIINGTVDVISELKTVGSQDNNGPVRLFTEPQEISVTSFIIQLSELNEVSEPIFSIDGDDILFKL